jgi:hypothetical protein
LSFFSNKLGRGVWVPGQARDDSGVFRRYPANPVPP